MKQTNQKKINLMYIVLEKIIKNSERNSGLILKLQQRCRSETNNFFTEEIDKVGLNANNDKRIQ